MTRVITILMCVAGLSTLYYLVDPEMSAPESFEQATIGFLAAVVAAALVLGEIGRWFRLPRVATYATTGIVGALAATSLLDSNAALTSEQFARILSLVGAPIGLAVGIRINLSSLAANSREVSAHVFMQTLLVCGLVTATVWFGQSLVPGPKVSIWGALALGFLASLSGLDAVVGVNGEMGSTGNTSRIQTQVAFFRDIIAWVGLVVVTLAASLEAASPVVEHTKWLSDLASALIIATIAGTAVAGFLIVALKYASPQLNVVALSLALAATLLWGGSPVLVILAAAAAGIIIENTTRYGFTLTESLEQSAPLYFSVFFVVLFTTVKISLAWLPWLVIAALFLSRTMGLALASKLVTRLRNNPLVSSRHLSASLLAQGAPAVFSLEFIISQQPDWAHFRVAYAPLIFINLFLGSGLHRWIVARSKALVAETPTRSNPDAFSGDTELTTLDVGRAAPQPTRHASSLAPRPDYPQPEMGSESLDRMMSRIRQRLTRIRDKFEHSYFDAQFPYLEALFKDTRARLHEHVLETFESLRQMESVEERVEHLRAQRHDLGEELRELMSHFGGAEDAQALKDSLERTLDRLERACELKESLRAPVLARHVQPQEGDTYLIRLRKMITRLAMTIGPRPTRLVPTRLLADVFVVDGFPEAVAPAINMATRQRSALWRRLQIIFDSIDELYAGSISHLERSVRESRPDDTDAMARESRELAEFEERLRVAAEDLKEEITKAPEPELLIREGSEAQEDILLAYWTDRLGTVGADFDQAWEDLVAYDTDARRRLDLAFSKVYVDFVDGLHDGGTFLLPARRLNVQKRESCARAAREERFEDIDAWSEARRATLDARLMRLYFLRLQFKVRRTLTEAVDASTTELYSHLTYYPAEISERCEDVARELAKIIEVDPQPDDLKPALTQIRGDIIDFLQNQALADAQDMRETGRFGRLVRTLIERLERLVHDGPQNFTVIEESELWLLPETSSARGLQHSEIPYGDLLNKFLLRPCVSSYNELDLEVRGIIDTLSTGLSEISRIISFNLDAAASELHRADDSSEDIEQAITAVADFAVGGLERAAKQAAALLEEIQTDIDRVDNSIIEETARHMRETRRLLFETSVRERRQAIDALEHEGDLHRLAEPSLDVLRQRGQELAHRVMAPIRDLLLDARDRAWRDQDFDDLREQGAKASFQSVDEEVPVAYRRLFTAAPVEISELWVERPAPMRALERAAGRFRRGARSSIAILGETGIGKTSFAHRAMTQHLGDFTMLRWNVRSRLQSEVQVREQLATLFNLRGAPSIEHLVHGLTEIEHEKVVLVDGLETLALRTVEGLEAISAFLRVMAESPTNILWVATCNEALWRTLDSAMDISQSFTDTIELQPLSREQLERLIMRRHRLSGFDFEADSEDLGSVLDRWFDQLTDAADGNPLLAIYYWIHAIHHSEKDSHVRLTGLEELHVRYLHHLDDEKLLSLGQFVAHERLTEQEFARVMRLAVGDARRELAFLESTEIVSLEGEAGGTYHINPLLYHDVRKVMSKRAIL